MLKKLCWTKTWRKTAKLIDIHYTETTFQTGEAWTKSLSFADRQSCCTHRNSLDRVLLHSINWKCNLRLRWQKQRANWDKIKKSSFAFRKSSTKQTKRLIQKWNCLTRKWWSLRKWVMIPACWNQSKKKGMIEFKLFIKVTPQLLHHLSILLKRTLQLSNKSKLQLLRSKGRKTSNCYSLKVNTNTQRLTHKTSKPLNTRVSRTIIIFPILEIIIFISYFYLKI